MAQIFYSAPWDLQALAKREVAFVSSGIVLIVLLYRALNTLYCCYFHPLSHFTGPSAAARSNRWIYRVTDGGFPEEELENLHETYREYQLALRCYYGLRIDRYHRDESIANWP